MTDDAEILPSAYLDGELTAEEQARVEADPELLAEAARLGEIRDRVADVEPPSTSRREAHLAAALAARGAGGELPPPTGPRHDLEAPVTSIGRTRWRSSTGLVAAAAAAVALIIGAGIVVNTAGQGDDDDIASDARSASETNVPAETEPLDEREESADDSLAAEAETAEDDTEAAEPLDEAAEESAALPEDAPAATEAPAETEPPADGEADEATDGEAADAAELPAEAAEATEDDADLQPDAAEETADDARTDAPPVIVEVAAFDPDGDGTENDTAAAALATTDPAAPWSTVCYQDRFMGAKRGVGLVVSFDRPSERALVLDVQSAPYQLRFYATPSEEPPTTFEGWGEAVGDAAGVEPVPVGSPVLDEPVRHVLIVFEELGPDSGCSAANPYRGTIGSIRFDG